MTDERNPSDDVLDAIAGFQHRNESLHRHHDLDKPTCAYCTLAAKNALKALSAAGFVVVRAPGLNHGDELGQYTGDGRSHPRDVFVRRPVPEPATKPPTVEVECDQCGITAEFADGSRSQVTERFRAAGWTTPSPFFDLCPACGGSGAATTEGDKQ